MAAMMCPRGPPPPHVAKAWEFFRRMGSPKLHVAPMVDQSELPFRLLCRRHGATCAYTPMLNARLFAQSPEYRAEQWSTCPQDRPLIVQFCANDPDTLLAAARLVEGAADAVDLNLGCPQRLARHHGYGAFLMDDLPLIERMVRHVSSNLSTIPLTCKIRIFADLEKTIAYARMLEAAGCCLLAVHGRTRDQKDQCAIHADWDAICAVKAALHIPVLANGNIATLADVEPCLRYTGADGVLSAVSLLADPALFSPRRLPPGGGWRPLEAVCLAQEYMELVHAYPVPVRMVKGHLNGMLACWLADHVDLRARLNGQQALGLPDLAALVAELAARIQASGRDAPVARLSRQEQAELERQEARALAMQEQEREEAAVAALDERGAAASKKHVLGQEGEEQDVDMTLPWDCCHSDGSEHPGAADCPPGAPSLPLNDIRAGEPPCVH